MAEDASARPPRGDGTLWRILVGFVLAVPLTAALTGPSSAATTPTDPSASTSAVAPDPTPADPAPADPAPSTTAAPEPAPSTGTAPPEPVVTVPPSSPQPTRSPKPAPPAPTTSRPSPTSVSSGPPAEPRPSPSASPPPVRHPSAGSPPAAAVPNGSSPGSQETEPTSADLQAQQDAVHQLDLRIAAAQDAVGKAQAELERAALLAGQALDTYSRAVKQLQAAQLEDQRQGELLTQAQAALTSSQVLMGRWVRQAYRDGADVGADLGLVSLLGATSTDDLGSTRQFLRRVGDSRSRTLSELERALAAQTEASARAQASAQAAAAAATTAQDAKAAADAAVKEQRDTLARLEQVLASSTAAAAAQRAQLATARADFEAALRLSALPSSRRSGSNAVTGSTGDCTGEGIENYPNGQIPLALLCPLAADQRHHLRADAAFAFDRLSRAYVAHFGTPPCITDSYRSLSEQIRLYAVKPNLAARPGTSNHGWGTALDMCGGIQSFDSETHRWMRLNAPLYGWFHPAWAQRGGSKPEPWHWEFSG